ncbi:acyl carrier protein [Clostridium bornimense]|uniref:acyl carrier protein n=1 Tax=Clostridium bornimense TaxID=1216932 RepID=UPI001C11049E|nr:acyl carrier protein [Clostridium bornimense]MBU5317549.1 acyl carrier protein [Clostridium bornimense]
MEYKIKEIIANYLGMEVKDIDLKMDIIEDLGINSYDIVSIVGNFEDEFDIEIPEKDIRMFKTIEDVVNYFLDKEEI